MSGSWLDSVIVVPGSKFDLFKTETFKSYQGTLSITPIQKDAKITVLCNLTAFEDCKMHYTE
jgi:hypothetical protein